ncbi:unnamed protein product [Caenorhabditis bovis]|uniref:Uncharacterized protein n=1 Tax=Caenorhabditis bovis TaxID=2654633 RepID=A0A8S1EZB8_9PELO|nr:unnamed protein product [Caenorhabditis bovis]
MSPTISNGSGYFVFVKVDTNKKDLIEKTKSVALSMKMCSERNRDMNNQEATIPLNCVRYMDEEFMSRQSTTREKMHHDMKTSIEFGLKSSPIHIANASGFPVWAQVESDKNRLLEKCQNLSIDTVRDCGFVRIGINEFLDFTANCFNEPYQLALYYEKRKFGGLVKIMNPFAAAEKNNIIIDKYLNIKYTPQGKVWEDVSGIVYGTDEPRQVIVRNLSNFPVVALFDVEYEHLLKIKQQIKEFGDLVALKDIFEEKEKKLDITAQNNLRQYE